MCGISKEIRGAALNSTENVFALTALPVFQNNANKSMRKITRALSKNNTNAAQRDSEGVFLCGFLGVLERKISVQ